MLLIIPFSAGGILWLAISALIFIETARSLQLEALDVPGWVSLGSRPALSCRWQLGPADVLYSVKWYKDGKEFFRHVPRDSEPRRRFPLPGVEVEEADSLGSKLILAPATLETGGRYRCEVSGEKPLFPTVSNHADMDVIAFPEHGPIISSFHSSYYIGDRIQSTCTSGHSRPATQLTWYINGDPLPAEEYTTSYRSENSLIVTTLTLNLEVTEEFFRIKMLKIKCLATIIPVYWKSNEEAAILKKNKIYNDTEIISKTQKTKRADRVQSNTADSNSFNNWYFIGFFLVNFL